MSHWILHKPHAAKYRHRQIENRFTFEFPSYKFSLGTKTLGLYFLFATSPIVLFSDTDKEGNNKCIQSVDRQTLREDTVSEELMGK